MMSDMNLAEAEDNLLPPSLTTWKFTAARSKEVQIMKRALAASSTGGVKLAFQKLPRHMRRKTTAHKVKRLPRRIREIHLCQMRKSGGPQSKPKRPSRKYRRRPSRLCLKKERGLTTFDNTCERRRKSILWLPTHIWHAKRFHMIEKWGYKLSDRPCDKAFRACYRAVAHHCLLRDISYYGCVEITGDSNGLIERLRLVTDTSSGLTFAARSLIDGRREGNTTLYSYTDPGRAIGQVWFIWRPDPGTRRTIWIWLHPAFYKEALETFTSCLGLNLQYQKYCSEDESIELKELKFELSRFRLTGPLSNAVLQRAFKLEDPDKDLEKEEKERITIAHDYWNGLQGVSSPGELRPGTIIPLLIQDPRFNLPKKCTKALPKATESGRDFEVEPSSQLDSTSPIWDMDIRMSVSESKISQAKFMELRTKLLVPGSDILERPASLPVMLVQVAGKGDDRCGFACGWDVILPSSWSQPLWLSLVMWGARVGGLRESDSIDFECGHQDFLRPDTSSGVAEEGDLTKECRDKFFRLPPNKRVNYNKFKTTSPFSFNWRLLMSEWNDGFENVTVLRDKKLLRSLREALSSKSVRRPSSLPDIPENSLVPVCVKMAKRGPCRRFALICLPLEKDLNIEPIEGNCSDPNEKIRKHLREEHKLLLKRLRRGRVRAKHSGKAITPIDAKVLTSYTEKMRELWLPETKTIRHSCSREVMGFIKRGGFSFAIGKTKGIGYVSARALKQLMNQRVSGNKVLVRNTNSRQYRLGNLEVICD